MAKSISKKSKTKLKTIKQTVINRPYRAKMRKYSAKYHKLT